MVRGDVRLSGGGALLPGLADRLGEVAGLGVVVAEDPLRCVVRGAAAMLAAGARPERSLSACCSVMGCKSRKTRHVRRVE